VVMPKIVVLTGAGVSAESGIPTFRASDGLWEQHRIEDVATPEGFLRDPDLVQNFYNQRRALLKSVQPNPAHDAIARLQQQWPDRVTLITQNIDDLHERAGSPEVIHMHGELLKVRCVRTGQVYAWSEDVTAADRCSCCQLGAVLRPHIVWFGEEPLQMQAIYEALSQADLFVAIGTSGHVYPAAGFVAEARQGGARTLEFNLEPSQQRSHFVQAIYGPAGETLPLWVDKLLASPDQWQRFMQGKY
jgi:NAD-dependent deacetylase